MKYLFVYVTAPGIDEAKTIAKELLKDKLIACANIHPVSSSYWWKGKIENDDEYVLVAKSKKELFNRIVEKIKEIHPYEVPCVVALPILKGNPDYLNWIEESVE